VPRPDPAALRRFIETFLYREAGFLLDEVLDLDPEERAICARVETAKPLPWTQLQRSGPHHPAHVAGADLLGLTGSLGCLHAWFFHGCRWDEGWTGFGSRVHRADFKALARLGPPLELRSRETRTRAGPRRVVIRYEFRFAQEGRLVYRGEQSAIFLKEPDLSAGAGDLGEEGGDG
jgi:hypothetical protein